MSEIAPDATVWVAGKYSGNNAEKTLHTSRDCRALQNADSVLEKQRGMYHPDQRVCQICTGAYEPTTDTGRSQAYLAAKEVGND
jgi:hypothetical protein